MFYGVRDDSNKYMTDETICDTQGPEAFDDKVAGDWAGHVMRVDQ